MQEIKGSCMPPKNLHNVSMLKERTIELLRESPKSVPMIAEDCGVSVRWLKYLKADKWDDPGVNKIERVYTYLTGRQIRLIQHGKQSGQVREETNP